MKVCFVTSTLTSGGSERVMSLLANKFVEKGLCVEIINLNKHIVFYPLHEEVRLSFAEDEVGTSIWNKIVWLRRHISFTRPDVVIPFMEAVYCFTLLSLLGVHVPVISSERIDPRKSPWFRNIIRRVFLPLTDWLVVQTKDIKSFYPSFIRRKTSIIYNPISGKVFSLAPVEKKNRIISIGKLDYQKNQKILIQAFAKLAPLYSDYQLLIYGEGPLRDNLQHLIDDLQLKDRVLLPGRSDKVLEEMNQSKMFVFSSDFEGLSNALIEAVCVGLPIVTTRVSGVSELIENGKTGFVVPCRDVDAFADAMRVLLDDENLMKKMGNENKKKVAMFDLNNIAGQWEDLINKVVFDYC